MAGGDAFDEATSRASSRSADASGAQLAAAQRRRSARHRASERDRERVRLSCQTKDGSIFAVWHESRLVRLAGRTPAPSRPAAQLGLPAGGEVAGSQRERLGELRVGGGVALLRVVRVDGGPRSAHQHVQRRRARRQGQRCALDLHLGPIGSGS